MTKHSFTSSSGYSLHIDGLGNLCIDEDVALEKGNLEPVGEFFQHERDRQLDRVRWPEHPDYVVYPYKDQGEKGEDAVRVMHELDGRTEWFLRSDVETPPIIRGQPFREAAFWFFHEGPGRPTDRPWEQAQPGEVWWINVLGTKTPAVADGTRFRYWVAGFGETESAEREVAATSPDIIDGRMVAHKNGEPAEG